MAPLVTGPALPVATTTRSSTLSVLLRSAIAAIAALLCIGTPAFGQSGDVVIAANTTWAAGTYNLTSLTVQGGATLTVGGGSMLTVTGSILITANSNMVLQSINNTAQVSGTWQGAGVTINAVSVQVDSGSSINADSQGYVAKTGPGAINQGTQDGGSYGGIGGGQTVNDLYGSDTAPVDLGSGGDGGTPGAGGGAIRLVVSGTLTDNGVISANGQSVSGSGGGGAGGSIYVTAGSLAGAGAFTANGGSNSSPYGDGGGGGRIAVYFNSATNFTGFSNSTTLGGSSAGDVAGTNGTVVFFDTSVTNDNLDLYQDFLIPASSTVTYNSITVNNGAVLTIGGGSTVTVTGGVLVTDNSSIIFESINNTAQVNGTWQGVGATLNAASVQVDSGSSINADGQGYVAVAGPGTGQQGNSNGGSYGGIGAGQAASTIYGSASTPTDLGSGGGQYQAPGGPGGGAVALLVSGTLINNGVISSEGTPASGFGGGGSGGSVYVTAGNLSGAGTFNADGGGNNTPYGGGGGGGRVAIYYASQTNFTGFASSTANGGVVQAGASPGSGSVGTVAFFDTSAPDSNVSVFQNYVIPANTNVQYNSVTVAKGAIVTVGGGSQIAVAQTMHVSGTVIAQSINNTATVNGAWAGQGVTFNLGSLLVDQGASLNADNQGYGVLQGPGGGRSGDTAGGSYGGAGGGRPVTSTYGSAPTPVDLGSGGAHNQGTGGAGGGAIRITVSGTLTNEGVISANGQDGTGFSGGGAGGSIYVTTATLAGSGTFTANGGNNSTSYGGGGGGGRIAVYSASAANFTGFATSTANGGTTPSGATPGPGSVGTVAFFDTSVPNSNVSIYQNYVIPANTNVQYNSLTVGNGATVTVGGGSQVITTATLHVTGTMTAQSINNTGQVNGQWAGQGVKIVAGTAVIDPGASINADGQGYLTTVGPGSVPNAIGNNLGGSYGGAGGGQSSSTTYGSASFPTDLGSGGGISYGGGGGSGGGAIELDVIGTLTNNGTISANGATVTQDVGGGSGGSLNIAANTIAGTGTITAGGGSNSAQGGGGGGGGRIAVYYINNTGFNQGSATAQGGDGNPPGSAGTVIFNNTPVSSWIQPTESVVYGVTSLQWFTDNGNATTITIAGPQTSTIATGTAAFSSATWDTTQVPDGTYQLVLSVFGSSNQVVQQIDKTVVVNNSVVWHSGTLTSSQTWSANQVQGLDGDVIVPAGVVLTIAPGTVVKALPGAQIIVQSGGTLIATGSPGAPVTFTTFDDSSVGGDTDFNQGVSLPVPGEWNGIDVLTGGTFTSNTNTIVLYAQTNLSGTLSANTTLNSTQVCTVTGTLVVPSGITFNILPGAVIKFQSGAGIDVQPGATLTANGTLAQPIYFTSINDSSVGGDTAGNGGATAPAPGDWNSIILDGTTVSLQHVQVQYGGGPVGGGAQAGMIETTDNANVTITNSVLASSYAIGIQTAYPNGGGDTVTVTDSTFYGNEDRAINAYPGSTVHVVNDTFDGNSAGVMSHGGTVDVENSVISNSVGTQFGGVDLCCGGSFAALESNDVYTTTAGASNYAGISDPTGANGNISAVPVYMNGTLHDYRPTYGSPLIDAANGSVPNYPLTDAFGLSRYNDPLVTTKTGTPDINGNYPDIGAFEFVQTAPSNLDLTVSNIQGPSTATVDAPAQVTWTVTNIGSGSVYGPWHDAVYLVSDPNTNPVETYAGMELEGAGTVLGPGASYNATATITVPGTAVGSHRWEVKTNVLGEVFEGANTNNNTGVSLNPVIIDLTQLVPGASPIAGSFSGTGQSSFYKVIPDASQATRVQLALSLGSTGSVQLFVGGGYIPTPQHYDYEQVEFNSPSASVVIPADSAQIYYVAAYAQNISTSPASFTIQASAITFSLTSVTPNTAITEGNATLTFIGGGFTSNTTFLLVGSSGTTYAPVSTFISDSDHADVTFAMTNLPADVYAAEAINGSSVTLANALTVTANQFGGGNGTNGVTDVAVSLQVPDAFRTGFPSIVTLNYQNTAGYDVPAPMIYISATDATLAELPTPCANCSDTYGVQNGSTFNSGLVLGISNSGPAGILPAGASGSIQFLATPAATGTATFYVSGSAQNLVDTKLEVTNYGQCGVLGCIPVPVKLGAYNTGVDFCDSLMPPGTDSNGFTRACMQLLNNMGFTYTPPPIPEPTLDYYPPTPIGGYLPFGSFNNLLAADATALSAGGDYEYDVQKLLEFELQKDGLSQFNQQYHQGAFGFGPSQPFDITVSPNYVGSGFLVLYPDGSQRVFPVQSPTQPGVYLGAPGDYGVFAPNSDGSYLLTEPDGTQYHFLGGLNQGRINQLDYIQDRDSNRTMLTYTNGNMTSATDAFGNTISFQYDSYNHITQFTDAVGRITTFTYDTVPETVNGITTTYEFLLTKTDATGTTNYTWNEGSSLGIGSIDDSCVINYCGSPVGIASIAYPDGTHTYYQYDAAGRLVSESNDNGAQAINYTYGSNGTFTVTDALGHATQTVPNVLGLPLQITDPLDNQMQFRFDGENKLTNFIGALGDSAAIGYDNLGNLASFISPSGSFTNLSFTGDQSPTSLTDPSGNATGFSYDADFDLTAQTSPNGAQTTYTYDAKGNPLTRTNHRGNTVTYTYNTHGLPASKTYSNGSQVLYAYDAHNNLQSVTAPAGTTTYAYDSADRLTHESNPDGTALSFTYNAGGQRISMTDSTGFLINYAYDAVGRLTGLTNGSGGTIVSYAYDANGRLATKTFGNGTSTTYTYDASGNVLHVVNYSAAHAIFSEFDYTYDGNDRPITERTPTGNLSFTYDLDGQLTGVSTPSATIQYAYDASGNRTTYLPNNLNEYQSAGSGPFLYDADGNVIAGNGWTYTYDDDNRMLTMVSATDNWSFQYDGLGNRVASTHNGETTHYLIDPSGFGDVVAEFNGNGSAIAHYTYGLDLTSSFQPSGAASYYHFDGAGNTTQITDASGTVVNSYSYLPFGEQTVFAAGTANPFTYVGRYGVMDEGSGLYFMRNRWYNPTIGRFQQQDPLGLAGDINLYRYAANTPLVFVDPSGTAETKGFVQRFSESTWGQGLNFISGLIPNPAANYIAGAASNIGTADSLGRSLNTNDKLGKLHDTASVGARTLGFLPWFAPLGIAGTLDQGTQWIWNWESAQLNPEPQNGPLRHGAPSQPCGPCIFNKTPGQNSSVHGAVDPNGKLTSGFGSPGYVPAGSAIVYTVYFENQPTATAPAEEVTVTDPLDSNLDWSTVQFNQIAFNNVTLDLPSGVQTYTTQAAVSSDPNPVNVLAALNPSTGVITWTMQSVDPTTDSAPANPLAGFLPPNNSANAGSGYVTFSVMPKKTLANGSTINNQASIIFDANAPIATNSVTNTVDSSTPTSSVNPLPATTTSTAINVSWTGSDPSGSGIATYNIYEATDGGAYSLWLSATTLTSSAYTGFPGHSYSFYSLATNNVGVPQLIPAAAQTTSIVNLTPTVTVTPSAQSISLTQSLSVTVTVSGGSGNPTPTGSVTLTSGSYTSSATALAGGVATINIAAGSLAAGSDTLTVNYTPDSGSSSIYSSATGSNTVTVTTGTSPTFALTNGGNITVEASATTGNTSTITVTPSNGFTGAVNLTCAVTMEPPAATSPATCTVTPSVTISGTTAQNATLTVNTTTTTTAGAYAVAVTGTSGAITAPTTVGVTVTAYVPPPTFSLSNNGPITLEASATNGNTATITVAPANGFTGVVNLTCAVTTAPAGATSPATCAVSPSVTITGAASQNATLTVTTSTTTTAGAYAVTVTGTSGAITMPTIVNVTVTAYGAPSFTLSNGGAITISSPGATTGNTTTITVAPSGGFAGNVILTAALASSPSGANDPPTLSFGATSPVNIAGASNGTGTLTVTTTAATTGALVRPKSIAVPWYAAGGTALACLLFFGIPARRRRWRTMVGMFVLLALMTGGLVSCGSKSGGGGGGGGGGNSGTTPGTYAITVTGTSGSIMQTTTVNLTVN